MFKKIIQWTEEYYAEIRTDKLQLHAIIWMSDNAKERKETPKEYKLILYDSI